MEILFDSKTGCGLFEREQLFLISLREETCGKLLLRLNSLRLELEVMALMQQSFWVDKQIVVGGVLGDRLALDVVPLLVILLLIVDELNHWAILA